MRLEDGVLRLTRRFAAPRVRPERLAYTRTCEGEPVEMRGSENTLVLVESDEDGEDTQVILTHRGFADSHARCLHGEGWGGCLDNLERRVFGSEEAK